MGLPEPSGPLWGEVKEIWDPWPPDDEDVATRLGDEWRRAAETAVRAGQDAVAAGGAAYASWWDDAGGLFRDTVGRYGQSVDVLGQGMLMHGGAAARYAEQVRHVKETIGSYIESYQPYYDLLSSPAFGAAGRAMRDWLVRDVAGRLRELVTGTADRLGVTLSATGPDAGFAAKLPEGGRLGEVRAFAELFKVTAKGADARFTGEANLGAELSLSGSLTNEGLRAQLEAAAGLRVGGEFKDAVGPHGLVGYGAKVDGFAGGKAGAGLSVGPNGFDANAEAFAGGRGGVKLSGDVGGVGVGLTAEGWVGPGAAAGVHAGVGDDGVFRVGASAGASPLVGGKLGVELAVDTKKVVETAGHVRDAVVDGAETVGRGVESARRTVEDFGEDVSSGVDDVGRGFAEVRDRVGNLF